MGCWSSCGSRQRRAPPSATRRSRMIDDHLPGVERLTLAGDKCYDTRGFVEKCRERNVTPHVAKNEGSRRSSAIDARTMVLGPVQAAAALSSLPIRIRLQAAPTRYDGQLRALESSEASPPVRVVAPLLAAEIDRGIPPGRPAAACLQPSRPCA